MTTAEMSTAREGSRLWQEYVRVNGYAFRPTQDGLRKLSRLLDLNVPYIAKCITKYLEM